MEQVGVEGALLELHELLQSAQLLQPRLLLPLQHPSHLVHAHLPIPAFPRQQQTLLVKGRLESMLLRVLVFSFSFLWVLSSWCFSGRESACVKESLLKTAFA